MSLIHTAKLCGANPFDYLTELQRHADEVAKDPAAWLRWNYREKLGDVGAARRDRGRLILSPEGHGIPDPDR